tara:strand:- start:6662 stop:7564 length:903 start_codon:yes stop_codon:yes gene_type:complete
MQGLLDHCWANRQDGQYADEIYCFELLENHAVRVFRQNPGPHGMFYNQSIWVWNPVRSRFEVIMYTSNGDVIEREGAIEGDAAVVFDIDDETGEPRMRHLWTQASERTASLVLEQNLGEDYGGWTTAPTRTFTRQPENTLDTLRADMVMPEELSGGAVEYFSPLINACWETELADSRIDTHCFSSLFGRFVVHRHIVPGTPDYAGTTFYYWDAENEEIVSDYFNSMGGNSNAGGQPIEGGMSFDYEYYVGPDGLEEAFGTRFENVSDAGYTNITKQQIDGEWVEVTRQVFTRIDSNPFDN